MNLERWSSLLPKRPRKEGERAFCTAVIVAAGSSQRMGSDKIFAALGGWPVLVRSVRAFEASELVDEIITSTMVARMQMEARPAPLRFMRKAMDETETKWFGL